jgi:hypothetical protein
MKDSELYSNQLNKYQQIKEDHSAAVLTLLHIEQNVWYFT